MHNTRSRVAAITGQVVPRSAKARRSTTVAERDQVELVAARAAALAEASAFVQLAETASAEQLQALGRRLARAGNRLSEAASWFSETNPDR